MAGSERSRYQGRRPSDSNGKTVRASNADLVKPPFPMPENATWPDDKIVHPRRDCRHIWRSNENTERIVGFWNPPFSLISLGQVQFATPSFHDEIVLAAASTLEPSRSPKGIAAARSLLGTIANAPTAGICAILHLSVALRGCR